LESKPFKLIQPPWLSTLLTWVSIAVSVGSVALSWRLLRRHPYAIPLTASCLTLLAVVLVAHLLCRMASGGSGEGDFGWKAATDELVLEARGLLKPVVGISTFLGLIGFGLGRMRPLQ
jgi:hypothetical protein